ncbi:hypothetical protein ACFY0A_37110 [Streptomyces sp. NPDC001698]|uniref:hypothetical protein n=1 Tax=unclassified Streptomyces TaxID=2593676 RepID=UPI0036A65F2A
MTVTVSAAPGGTRRSATPAPATSRARVSEAMKQTIAAPLRSTRAPAKPNAATRGIHSSAKARPVRDAEPVVASTTSGMA